MERVETGKPIIFKCSGSDLAKVLTYYGYEPDTSSAGWKMVCPFHKDMRPSMVTDFSDGTFHCFACEVSGDAWDFVQMKNPKMKPLDSVRKFFRILKSKKVCRVEVSAERKETDSSLKLIAEDYYYNLPTVDWEKETEGEETKKYLLSRGFTEKTLSKAGAKLTYNKQYPVVFPILDNGSFRGWVCRTDLKVVEEKRKYLYNKGFSRYTSVAGSYGKLPYLFVVEGYMDRLKFVQFGINNVVALLGWKMTAVQEEEIKAAGVVHIISALDNDECGRRGTEYLKTRFSKVTRFRYLKTVKDPGDMDETLFWKMYARTMEDIVNDNETVYCRSLGKQDGGMGKKGKTETDENV